jgi:hypothetical protein
MSQMVFLLEEPSAKAMLEGLLPRIVPVDISPVYIVFQGKQDLEARLVQKIRGYCVPGARFVVLRDQDSGPCQEIKATLTRKCRQAGHGESLVRIVCHELESWYLGDLAAVEKGLEVSGLSRKQGKLPFRDPDALSSPSRQMKRMAPTYQKVGGSRAIGPHLDPENVRSRSFAHFVLGIRRLCKEWVTC